MAQVPKIDAAITENILHLFSSTIYHLSAANNQVIYLVNLYSPVVLLFSSSLIITAANYIICKTIVSRKI